MLNTGTDKHTRKPPHDKIDYLLYSKRPWVLTSMRYTKNHLYEVGEQTLFGKQIMQSWSALYMIENFLVEHPRDIIIELGTASGALSILFGFHAETWTYDINKPRSLSFYYNFTQADVFNPETRRQVGQLIHGKRALIFCDDGNKAREMNEYAALLDSDDFMLVHDYNRPDGVHIKDIPKCLETYRQDEWDKLETYILCLRAKRKV